MLFFYDRILFLLWHANCIAGLYFFHAQGNFKVCNTHLIEKNNNNKSIEILYYGNIYIFLILGSTKGLERSIPI